MAIPLNRKPEGQQKDDEGLWKVGEDYYEISQMDNDFLEKAFYHCIEKIGYHSQRIKKAMASLGKFEEKSREIYREMKRRGVHDRLDQTPTEALREHIGDKIKIRHEKEAS